MILQDTLQVQVLVIIVPKQRFVPWVRSVYDWKGEASSAEVGARLAADSGYCVYEYSQETKSIYYNMILHCVFKILSCT